MQTFINGSYLRKSSRMRAIDEIVFLAIEKKAGARALRSVLEELLTDVMYNLPDLSSEGAEKIIITKDYIINRIPLGHVGQTEDVADAVLFLASDMSKMVTGSSIKVDGGWTAV